MSDSADRPLAVVFGCRGPRLGDRERRLFAEANPLGLILFARNCRTPDQVRGLVRSFRETVGRSDAPVLIDQEGGRVQRLKPPHWASDPPAGAFGDLAARDGEAADRAAGLRARAIAGDLSDLGITVNAAPVLDLRCPGQSDVVGDRAFGRDPELVGRLGAASCNGYLAGGVLPILKHCPGHGRAVVDSHQRLPVVDADPDDLDASDYEPFRRLAAMPMAMTAHILYPRIDPHRPGTLSPIVIHEVVRRRIGFPGLLVSDDLCMGALRGTPGERATQALAAGCDIALHCNGALDEMRDVVANATPLRDESMERLAEAEHLRQARRAAEPEGSGRSSDHLRAEMTTLLRAGEST